MFNLQKCCKATTESARILLTVFPLSIFHYWATLVTMEKLTLVNCY